MTNAPEGYNPHEYPPFAVTVDLNIFTIRNGVLSILLVNRGEAPYEGHWALPGGFIGVNENSDNAAVRELEEETGVRQSDFNGHLEQLKTYSDPNRDPRMRVVSVAYVALAPNLPEPVAGDDAADARWWAVEDLFSEDAPRLAFDHATIITDALERVKAKLEYTTLALQFVTEPFTLNDMWRVYTTVWGFAPDLANFRRKVLSVPDFVVATDEKSASASGPRPLLYRAGTASEISPPFIRNKD